MSFGNASALATAETVTEGRNGECPDSSPPPHSTSRPCAATLIRSLAELYPGVIVAERWQPHRPLKIGIRDDLVASGIVTQREACIALHAYCTRRMYLAALASGKPRYDLGGNVAGEVSPGESEWAQIRIGHIEAKAAAKAAETRAAHRAAREGRKRAKPKPPAPPTTEPRRLSLADLKCAAQERRAATQ